MIKFKVRAVVAAIVMSAVVPSFAVADEKKSKNVEGFKSCVQEVVPGLSARFHGTLGEGIGPSRAILEKDGEKCWFGWLPVNVIPPRLQEKLTDAAPSSPAEEAVRKCGDQNKIYVTAFNDCNKLGM